MVKQFRVKKPCANCPFRDDGNAIALSEGRLQGIVDDLLADDWATFQCHKTVHTAKGGSFDDDGNYHPSGSEAMCAGAMAYLHKVGRYSVQMRLALVTGDLKMSELDEAAAMIIEPY